MRPFKKLLLTALALALSFPAYADFTGNVVSVADGDTITVLDESKIQHKVRLAEIDAPEKAQAFGSKSKQALSTLVFNKQVSVVNQGQDKYKRTIGRVLVIKTALNGLMYDEKISQQLALVAIAIQQEI